MTKPLTPNSPYLLVHWDDLEIAWRMLASPDKQARIDETLSAVQTLNKSVGPEKAVFTMIAATAWLTDDTRRADEPVSSDGLAI